MRVLLASPLGGVHGGISRWTEHIHNYYLSLKDNNIELDFFSTARSKYISINTPYIKRIIYGLCDSLSLFTKFKNKVSSNKYDIIHITSSASLGLFRDFLFLQIIKKSTMKSVLQLHFGRIPQLYIKKNWEWKMLCKVINLSCKVIVIDKTSYDTLISAGFHNIVILPNPLSSDVLDIIKSSKNIERVPRSILFVGHVIKTKGVFELLQACIKIPNIKLNLIGHVVPDVKEQLLSFGLSKNDNNWLNITGELPYGEIIREMLKCDIFILPTYTEGFPNVILESMACGCSIIASRVGAIPEMLEVENNHQYGLLIEPKNVHEIYDAINLMLSQEKFKNGCGINAKNRVTERYNIESVWNAMVGIWYDVVLLN